MKNRTHTNSLKAPVRKLCAVMALLMMAGPWSSCQDAGDETEFDESEDLDPRIVGGQDAEPTPYFVMTLRESSTGSWSSAGCGASLISNCYALTAAHCVSDSRVGITKGVYVNAYQPYLSNSGVPYHFTRVTQEIPHDGFVDANNKNDIALLKLQDCVPEGKFEPVRLAPAGNNLSEGQMLEVYGFGKLGESNNASVSTLQKVSVPFIPYQKCKGMYPTVADDTVCAGYDKGGKDSCQGDSGGPLVDNRSGSAVQVGVVSWGTGCARAGAPGVYSSVSAHYDWIVSNVCKDAREAQFKLCGKPIDNCPNDPSKTQPGLCGCGVPEGTCSGGSACVEAPENGTASLSCPTGQTIVSIDFASYGVPTGSCPSGFATGACHATSSLDKVKASCLNKSSCALLAGNSVFSDPCSGKPKKLAVVYTCGGGVDSCPSDPNKTVPGICGCGVPDTDTDKDGIADCKDGCKTDPGKIAAGICGCGVPDIDTDKDGTADCNDKCPADPAKIVPGQCGCGKTEGTCSEPNPQGQGYLLSKSSSFATNDTSFSTSDTLYLRVWDSSVNASSMKKAEYQLAIGSTKSKGSLTKQSNGTFTAAISLSKVSKGTGKLSVSLQDNNKKKYQANLSITVN